MALRRCANGGSAGDRGGRAQELEAAVLHGAKPDGLWSLVLIAGRAA
jgi:hypothetical protein